MFADFQWNLVKSQNGLTNGETITQRSYQYFAQLGNEVGSTWRNSSGSHYLHYFATALDDASRYQERRNGNEKDVTKAFRFASRAATYLTHLDKKASMNIPSQHREAANDPLSKLVIELHGVINMVNLEAT